MSDPCTEEARESAFENRPTEYYYYIQAYKGKLTTDWNNDVYNDYVFNLDDALELITLHHRDNLKILVSRYHEI
tara:strand:- start:1239 stop:1460 length:222 start_codon:yes stop_codon:yes gene_type:complete